MSIDGSFAVVAKGRYNFGSQEQYVPPGLNDEQKHCLLTDKICDIRGSMSRSVLRLDSSVQPAFWLEVCLDKLSEDTPTRVRGRMSYTPSELVASRNDKTVRVDDQLNPAIWMEFEVDDGQMSG